MIWFAVLAAVVCGGVALLLLCIDQANVGGSPAPPSPGGGPSDYCPCGGTLAVTGAGVSWHARCVRCQDTFILDDDLQLVHDRIPRRVKVYLLALPVLLWIAGHVEVIR